VTSSIDGAIARAACAHLAAALAAPHDTGSKHLAAEARPPPAAGIATGRLLVDDVCEDALAPVRGVVRIPSKQGLGL